MSLLLQPSPQLLERVLWQNRPQIFWQHKIDAPTLTPVEISRLLSDTHAALQRTLAANRILAMMLADEVKAEKMAYSC